MKNKNYFGLIMAGGQGTRFWPYSTREKPKQFINIVGKTSLITQTYNRLTDFLFKENIFIVADGVYLPQVEEAIQGFNKENFIAEPVPKNTAPCLILANIFLSRLNKNANLIVVPADHYIPDGNVFSRQLSDALEYADNKCLVTSGIKPDSPHTGYGYINFDINSTAQVNETVFHSVEAFREKPGLKTAREYVKKGNYYWNSGMFIYKLSFFKEFLKIYAPYYFAQYLLIEKQFPRDSYQEVFMRIKPDSIDYALMEKVKEVKMFKAEYFWSDVGAWSSVYELGEKDVNNNCVQCSESVQIDTRDSLIFSTQQKPVAVIGLSNIAVINTENGLLVADKNELQKVKGILNQLKK